MKSIIAKNITEKVDLMNLTQKSSFLNANSTPVLMESGDSLWRFISRKKDNIFSDYWIDGVTMSELMGVFRSWGDYEMHTKKNVVRDNLAILENWNSNLNWRVKVTFKQPVIAYKGRVGPQKFFASDPLLSKASQRPVERGVEHRIGGFDQYVIPRLKGISQNRASEIAEISHFAHL